MTPAAVEDRPPNAAQGAFGTSDPGAAGPGLLGATLVDGVVGVGVGATLLLRGSVTVLVLPPDGVVATETISGVLVAAPGVRVPEVAAGALPARVRSEIPPGTCDSGAELALVDVGRARGTGLDGTGLDLTGLDWSAAVDCGVVTPAVARTDRLVWITRPTRTPMVTLSTTAASTTANR